MSQVCKECRQDLPADHFYLQDGFRMFKKCKECTLKPKRKPKVCGFKSLPPEVQKLVKLAIPKKKPREIADQYGINYSNLVYWIRSGKVYA